MIYFPVIAIRYLGPVAGIVFLIGLISAAFPSADGALTSLTTSVSIDFLGLEQRNISEKAKTRIRYIVHLSIALLFFISVMMFSILNNKAVIDKLFTIAGYTYGPLLGLYSFGLFTTSRVNDNITPAIAIFSPLVCFFLSKYSGLISMAINSDLSFCSERYVDICRLADLQPETGAGVSSGLPAGI